MRIASLTIWVYIPLNTSLCSSIRKLYFIFKFLNKDVEVFHSGDVQKY